MIKWPPILSLDSRGIVNSNVRNSRARVHCREPRLRTLTRCQGNSVLSIGVELAVGTAGSGAGVREGLRDCDYVCLAHRCKGVANHAYMLSIG